MNVYEDASRRAGRRGDAAEKKAMRSDSLAHARGEEVRPDPRPWAKIDTGYLTNFKWARVSVVFADQMRDKDGPAERPPSVEQALRAAQMAHLASILYCAQHKTDGVFPPAIVRAFAGLTERWEIESLEVLYEEGLWIRRSDGLSEVHDYLKHQESAADATARSEAGRKGARARWARERAADANRIAPGSAEEKRPDTGEIEEAEGRFEEFWAHYPKKTGKKQARREFYVALQKVTLDVLVDSAKAYAKSVEGRDQRFTKGAAGWLSEERWTDDLETQPTARDNPYAGWDVA